jgi:hypothetical protein
MLRRLALFALLAGQAWPATKLLVTVVEEKTGRPVTGLAAADFTVLDGGTARPVEGAEFTTGPVDVLLALDTSVYGERVLPLAPNMIEQLQPKEQMAVVGFASSADLVQDFTSSRELLLRAVAGLKFGNQPRVCDAVYAAVDGGFQASSLRRVLLLVTAGAEGYSRTSEREVIRLARRNGVSIYPVYLGGADRLFEDLARQTGGVAFNLRDLRKSLDGPPGALVFQAMRSHYTLNLRGNLSLGEKLKVEVKRQGKYQASALPLE